MSPGSRAGCARCPVERLTWDEIHQFISALNAADRDVWTYRLPSEATSEGDAARAGSTADRYVVGHVDASAWCPDNSEKPTHPFGLQRPNAFGLYDVLGNVAEVVHDWPGRYPGGTVVDPVGPSRSTIHMGGNNPYRVTRGRDWFTPQIGCELAERSFFTMEMDRGARSAPSPGRASASSERPSDPMLPSPVGRLTEEPLWDPTPTSLPSRMSRAHHLSRGPGCDGRTDARTEQDAPIC